MIVEALLGLILGPIVVAPNGSGNDCTDGAPCSLLSGLSKYDEGEYDGILLRPGTYRVDSPVTLSKSVMLRGEGDGSVQNWRIYGSKSPSQWVSDHGMQRARLTGDVYAVWNTAKRDRFGLATKLERVTSRDRCRARAGSYYQSGDELFVNVQGTTSGIEAVTTNQPILVPGQNCTNIEIRGGEIGMTAGQAALFVPSHLNEQQLHISNITLRTSTFAYVWDDTSSVFGNGIQVMTSTNLVAKGSTFARAMNDGANLKEAGWAEFESCRFYDCGDETFSPHGTNGISRYCTYSGGGLHPSMDGSTVAVVQGSDWTFANCTFDRPKQGAAVIWTTDLNGEYTESQFIDCTILGDFSATGTPYGVRFLGRAGGSVRNCLLSGFLNSTPGLGRAISYCNGTHGYATQLVIAGNNIKNSRIGIEAENKVGSSDSLIRLSANTFGVNVPTNVGSGWEVISYGSDIEWR